MDGRHSKAVRSHDRERGLFRQAARSAAAAPGSRRREVAERRTPFRIEHERAERLLRTTLAKLPPLEGRVIHVHFAPELSTHGGKLLSRGGKGHAVHAGSDIRKREMVLDSDLLRDRGELARIFLHELHHFVWVRLGNRARRDYEAVVLAQLRARGELGWSAESLKDRLVAHDPLERTRKWRDYVCESFCDSGAWVHLRQRTHPEWTLAPTYRERRREWFREYLPGLLSL